MHDTTNSKSTSAQPVACGTLPVIGGTREEILEIFYPQEIATEENKDGA